MAEILESLLAASREFWLGMMATGLVVVVLVLRGDLVPRKSVQSHLELLDSLLQNQTTVKEMLERITVVSETLEKLVGALPRPEAPEEGEG